MHSSHSPSLEEFDRIARRVYQAMPLAFRRMCDGLVIQTAEWPDEATLDDMGIDSPYGLLGLYHGVDLTQKSIMDPRPHQDMVFLYRQPILAFTKHRGEDLPRVIAHVLIHEIGHHFGLSDDDMYALSGD
jgi:predicted Zn-dependent protease with MMP-like domain